MTNEMIPFNLEEALKNPDRVVYRNGEKPLEWHWFEKIEQIRYCLISTRNCVTLCYHYVDGNISTYQENDYDLLLLPLPEKRYWFNMYDCDGFVSISSVLYNSEEEANINISSIKHYIKTISFTI